MVLESVPMGADGVLLICACLEDALLEELAVCAREQGLFTLVEVHDEGELERAARLDCASIGVGAIGVNARDLRDFSIDLATVERIVPLIPEGVLSVAESGLHGPEDLLRVRAAGADAALVGTALMRSEDPEATLRNWSEVLEV
jgi:indole-3-glycerol phosphate synthase